MRNSILKKATVCTVAFLFLTPALAQKPFAPKISTPSTTEEVVNETAADKAAAEAPAKAAPKRGLPPAKKINTPSEVAHDEAVEADSSSSAPSPRGIHTHSLGAGIGQTVLLGNYSKYGDDKIAMDLFYAYAASYSFDVLVNAHWSKHQDKGEKMVVKGVSASIKSRLFEFDNFSPFVLGGLGFYAPRAQRRGGGTKTWTDEKITFGLNFGGGVDLRLNESWTIGAMGQMHWPFAVKQDSGSDLKGYYFKMLLTLMYTFP